MKLSDVDAYTCRQYARIDDADEEVLIEQVLLPAARGHVLGYTGLSEEDADRHPDLALACIALVSYLYDHRDLVADRAQLSPVLDSLLGMHAVNYI